MLRRNELVLVTFFFKSEECVCGHKKLKKKKSKHVGEVHRWRGRWLQTLCGNKNNPAELHGLPVKTEPD